MIAAFFVLRTAAWVGVASGSFAMAAAVVAPVVRREDPEPPRHARRLAPRSQAYAPDSLGRVVIGRDLFRFGRRPAATRYDAQRIAQPGLLPSPTPPLRLAGLLTGPDPMVLLEGIPGVEGARVLRVGESLGGIRVAGIRGRHALIVGADTTWTLTTRRP